MTSAALEAEFWTRSERAGRTLLLDERSALAFVARAEEENIAVVDIDQVSPRCKDQYQPLKRRPLTHWERLESWRQARLFIEALSGRGLFFEIALEPAWATHLAKLRYLFRTGAMWTAESRATDETLQ